MQYKEKFPAKYLSGALVCLFPCPPPTSGRQKGLAISCFIDCAYVIQVPRAKWKPHERIKTVPESLRPFEILIKNTHAEEVIY